jgi:uncharacterized protein YecT (DUF1311 family)
MLSEFRRTPLKRASIDGMLMSRRPETRRTRLQRACSPSEPASELGGNATKRSVFMRILTSLLFVLAVSAPVLAASTPSRRICNPDRIKQTNAWVDCLQKALDESEATLNATAGKIAAAMQAGSVLEEPTRTENRALFESTHKKWLSMRDDDCKSYGAHQAGLGFGAGQFRLMCLLDETMYRIDVLKARYAEELK